jgi:glutaredoxin-related protein
MRFRLFGSNTCNQCMVLRATLLQMKVAHEFVDAFDDANEELCESNRVDDLPHLQFLDDNGRVLDERIGSVAPARISAILRKFAGKS